MNVSQRLRMALLCGADITLLVALRPTPRHLISDVAAPHGWLARTGANGAAAELADTALWLCAAWLAIGLLAWLIGAVPGSAGRVGQQLARIVLPATVYRLAAGAAGVGIVFAPVGAGAMAPVPRPGAAATPAPVWPSDASPLTPMWPMSDGHSPSSARRARARGHSPSPAEARPGVYSVLVHRGDSLWSIAAGRLPKSASAARIGAQWPRWFAANRAVVGADPDRIFPGQVLHAPPAATHHHSMGNRT